MAQHRADDPPIYAEMVDKARRAGTSAPEGTELAMAWAQAGWTPTLADRPDGSWCEDRPDHVLSNQDGVD